MIRQETLTNSGKSSTSDIAFWTIKASTGKKSEKGNVNGLDAAYRELEEETTITKDDIMLLHIMDFTYYIENYYLEVYVGKLNKIVNVNGTENKLFWSTLDNNFFDETQYAGEGNIGHIVQHIETLKGELLHFSTHKIC